MYLLSLRFCKILLPLLLFSRYICLVAPSLFWCEFVWELNERVISQTLPLYYKWECRYSRLNVAPYANSGRICKYSPIDSFHLQARKLKNSDKKFIDVWKCFRASHGNSYRDRFSLNCCSEFAVQISIIFKECKRNFFSAIFIKYKMVKRNFHVGSCLITSK